MINNGRPVPLLFMTILLLLGTIGPIYSQEDADTQEIQQEQIEIDTGDTVLEDVLEDFDSVWEAISQIYVDIDFDGVDWNALKEQYRPIVESAPDVVAAYRQIEQMVGTLNNYNTFVVPPWFISNEEPADDGSGIELEYAGIGILLQELQSGEVMVLQVFSETPAEKAGVLVGDIIVGVEDWKVSGENPVKQIADRVRGPVDTAVTITFRDPDSAERDIAITRARIDLRPSVEDRFLEGSIGYLRIPMLNAELVNEASKALPRLLSSTALILDLRSVSSGNFEPMIQVAQWFLGPAHMGGFLTRQGPQALPFRMDAIAAYQRPMTVLTNSATYGVAEILAMLLREYRRARIVGRQSQGGFEVSQPAELPSGGWINVTIGRYISPQEELLPFEGLVPDNEVPPTDLATIRSGRDIYLEEAVNVLRNPSRL